MNRDSVMVYSIIFVTHSCLSKELQIIYKGVESRDNFQNIDKYESYHNRIPSAKEQELSTFNKLVTQVC